MDTDKILQAYVVLGRTQISRVSILTSYQEAQNGCEKLDEMNSHFLVTGQSSMKFGKKRQLECSIKLW